MNGFYIGDWGERLDAEHLRMNIVEAYEACISDNTIQKQENLSKSTSDSEKKNSLKSELSELARFDADDSQMKKRDQQDSEDLPKAFNMLDEHDANANDSRKSVAHKFKRQKRCRGPDRKFLC